MESETPTKICRTCFSEIDARAGKCPKCHSLQGPLKQLLIAGIILVVATLIGSAIWFDILVHRRLEPHGPNYAANIDVVSSRLFFVPKEKGHSASVVGQLRNSGTVAVDVITLEVRLLDKDGGLLDSVTRSLSEHLVPNDEISFKVPTYQNIHMPQDSYANHVVIVRSAKQR
ncbi:MAG: hypothetical protein HQ518_00460 [Rhodopirellula sp.]|nr:hypothetical protein [Rhodopirellula sp.]